MLTIAKNNIQPKAVALIIALLISGTFIIDRIVLFIARPYFFAYYNPRYVTKTIPLKHEDMAISMYMAQASQTYPFVVFHLLVLVAVLLVFFNQKLTLYKRELLFAYTIIAGAKIIWRIMSLIGIFILK